MADAMHEAMLDAGQERGSYRRIEVITGQRRRRQWTAEEKARIVAESFEEGANISEVARRHGVVRSNDCKSVAPIADIVIIVRCGTFSVGGMPGDMASALVAMALFVGCSRFGGTSSRRQRVFRHQASCRSGSLPRAVRRRQASRIGWRPRMKCCRRWHRPQASLAG